MGYRNGLMEQFMKENGDKIMLMVKDVSDMWMVIFLKESGRRIKQMGMEYINMQLEHLMKVNGKTICKKDLG